MPTSSKDSAGLPAWPAIACVTLLIAGCAGTPKQSTGRYSQAVDRGPDRAVDVSQVADAVPRNEPRSRYGNPETYQVLGKRYYTLKSSKGYVKRGIASWYGTKFHGHRTSSGEPYDMYAMSAAHKTLPLPTYARVTNLDNGRTVVVKINDRGPFHENRLIDLSYAAASRLGILGKGTGFVEVRAIDPGQPEVHTAGADGPAPEKKVPLAAIEPKRKPQLFLQLGAFLDRGNAERLQQRLGDVEMPGKLHIQDALLDRKHIYRVRIGPLDSVETADRITQRLQQEGIDPPRVVID